LKLRQVSRVRSGPEAIALTLSPDVSALFVDMSPFNLPPPEGPGPEIIPVGTEPRLMILNYMT